MEKLHAPWTDDEVRALNICQQQGRIHPFTCKNGHVIRARNSGWYCPAEGCTYTQSWAHAFMADPELWPSTMVPALRRTLTPDAIAFRIRAELVCCNIYDRIVRKELTIQQAEARKEWHPMCYYGEQSAQLAEGRCPGYETKPNICRCNCEGCTHNCSAHQEHAGGTDDQDKNDETSG